MCEELNEEQVQGRKIAENLVEHLEIMGADQIEFPIQTDCGCYLVKVIKTL
ncbi:MAG: hypothetical protein WC346_06055 [Methanogenium sp.]|jgi:hypothetical protein